MSTVSVGLPVYNGQRFLRLCLDSILGQSYCDFELIVSDNASTDETPRIVEEYVARDRRIRFERSAANQGAAWNHRRVLGLSRGRYFKWVGADDILQPRFLETCVAALEKAPAAVIAFPRTVIIDDRGVAVEQTRERLPLDSADAVERFSALMSALSNTQNPYYGVMRRDALQRVPPLGEFLAHDRCLLGRLALVGPFVEVPEYLMLRRRHAGNERNQTEEQRFHDPANPHRFRPREWRVLREHLTAIAAAPVGPIAKVRLLGRVVQWMVAQRIDLASEAKAILWRTA